MWEHCKQIVVYDGLAFLCGLHLSTGQATVQYCDGNGERIMQRPVRTNAQSYMQQIAPAIDQSTACTPQRAINQSTTGTRT